MLIGIPKETKAREGRVALVPEAVGMLVKRGYEVLVQAGAGTASGYGDDKYRGAGARILGDAVELYGEAELVVKVKEPMPAEYRLLRRDHLLFSFLHLPADKQLTQALLEQGLTAVAFESLEENGQVPLLAPMSDIAGRLAVQIGATLLHGYRGGCGLLLGGAESAERGHAVILGAGAAGCSAAALAAALGAGVTVFARRRVQREHVQALGEHISALPPDPSSIAEAARDADLLIGALRVSSGVAPKLVSAATVRQMKPGSVIVDIGIDQGGCIETIRPTNYDEPTYVQDGVIHFAVPNMPGAVPRTASQVLSAALAPYVLRLAQVGAVGIEADPALARAVNVADGRIVHPSVVEAFSAT